MTSSPSLSAHEQKHSFMTRLTHGGLALAVITQLGTSLIMHGPNETNAGDIIFQAHRYAGFAAFGFALLFWMTLMIRNRGTELGLLFPWVSADRRRAFFADLVNHLRCAIKLRLPEYNNTGPLASGIHGLGLLLISTMAASGLIYAVEVWLGMHSAEPDGMLAMQVHFALGNVVWAYLIGHASMAALHHFLKSASLTDMWRLRP